MAGTDAFVVKVTDAVGATDSIIVNVTVENVNDAPVISQGETASMSTDEGVTSVPMVLSFSALDAYDAYIWSIGTQGMKGTASIDSAGNVTYVSGADENGTDSFRGVVTDAAGATDDIAVSVTVNPVADAPTVADDSGTVRYDTVLTLVDDGAGNSSPTLLANEFDANGAWTLKADRPWLRVSDTHGWGDAVVTVSVDRTRLEPGFYAGNLILEGVEPASVITVLMRFPSVTGSIASASEQLSSANHDVAPPTAAPGPYVPNEVLVQLDPEMFALAQGMSVRDLREVASGLPATTLMRAAARLSRDYGLHGAVPVARGSSAFVMGSADPLTTVAELRRDGRVANAALNQVYVTYGEVNDPLLTGQWHYENIRLRAAWETTHGSSDVVVGVIDSAIDTRHPDLMGQFVDGFDFVTNTSEINTPADAHGTHVAGTIAAATGNAIGGAGVSPAAKIMPLNVFADGRTSEKDVARALYYAAGGFPYLSDGRIVCGPAP